MNLSKVSAKKTRVQHVAATPTTPTLVMVQLYELEVLRYEKGRMRVRCTRDNDTQCRVNQALKALGFVERVEAFSNEEGERLRLLRGRLVVSVQPFPPWNSFECWVEFVFTPALKAKNSTTGSE